MPKIIIGNRRSGKTTDCYKMLEDNPDAAMLVCTRAMCDYAPEYLKKRVFSYRSHGWCGFHKLIIDEADFMDESYLWKIPPENIIFIATSIFNSYSNPETWLRRMIMRYGYSKKMYNIDELMTFMHGASMETLDKEIFAIFKNLYDSVRCD